MEPAEGRSSETGCGGNGGRRRKGGEALAQLPIELRVSTPGGAQGWVGWGPGSLSWWGAASPQQGLGMVGLYGFLQLKPVCDFMNL